MKGLIVKSKWADLILNGYKAMELRGSNTRIRGTIGIIKSGSKMVYGTVDLIDCVSIRTEQEYIKYTDKHKVTYNFKNIPYKNLYGWVFENFKKYDKPIPYKHKQGCVVWVNI